MDWSIFNQYGQRKYLSELEVNRFIKSANIRDIDLSLFAQMMANTGCRISEALSLTARNIDFEAKIVIIRSLKKRDKIVFRAIPLPSNYLKLLYGWASTLEDTQALLWPWSRMTGYRRIREIMDEAGIRGSHATPKGLRHSFGVRAIQAQVPLPLVQRWLGHANIKTTAIYTSAMGPEERELAELMWRRQHGASKSSRTNLSVPDSKDHQT